MSTILERYREAFQKDLALAQKARKLLPDGITSDSRYCEPFPIYVERAQGSKKWGVGGKEFIDYWAGHGALLLGHNPPEIVAAVADQLQRGTHYGACHELEIEWAELIVDLIPSAEKVRFTNTGTEANLLAVRLARAYSGKNKLLRFAGHYHGWQESLMLGVGSENTAASGIPPGVFDTTVICQSNHIDEVERHLKNDPDIACVILEPTGACSGVIPTNGEFLVELRALTRSYGVLLIFDEIFTGFRLSPGGAQGHFNVLPDLTSLAKLMAGGLPGGAVAGKKEILDLISNSQTARTGRRHRVPHLGTTNANLLSAAAGIAMLTVVKTGNPHEKINRLGAELRQKLNDVFDHQRLDWVAYGKFSWIKLFVGHGVSGLRTPEFNPETWDHDQLMARGDSVLRNNLRCGLLLNGVDFAPSCITATSLSSADIDKTVAAFEQTIDWMRADGLIPRPVAMTPSHST